MWGYAGNRVTCNVEFISRPATFGDLVTTTFYVVRNWLHVFQCYCLHMTKNKKIKSCKKTHLCRQVQTVPKLLKPNIQKMVRFAFFLILKMLTCCRRKEVGQNSSFTLLQSWKCWRKKRSRTYRRLKCVTLGSLPTFYTINYICSTCWTEP